MQTEIALFISEISHNQLSDPIDFLNELGYNDFTSSLLMDYLKTVLDYPELKDFALKNLKVALDITYVHATFEDLFKAQFKGLLCK